MHKSWADVVIGCALRTEMNVEVNVSEPKDIEIENETERGERKREKTFPIWLNLTLLWNDGNNKFFLRYFPSFFIFFFFILISLIWTICLRMSLNQFITFHFDTLWVAHHYFYIDSIPLLWIEFGSISALFRVSFSLFGKRRKSDMQKEKRNSLNIRNNNRPLQFYGSSLDLRIITSVF